MASAWIFPTSLYGQLTDTYGTAITQYNTYPNTTGFPQGSGLVQGTAGLLFDFTMTQLLNYTGASLIANGAVTYTVGATPYQVVSTTTINTIPIIATNDRGGAVAAANTVNWFTIRGYGTSTILGAQTAPKFLVSSGTAGTLTVATAGTSIQGNIFLLNTTTGAGACSIYIQ